MNYLKNKWYHLSLKYKILSLSLLVAVIPLLLFAGITSQVYRNTMEERGEKQLNENLSVIIDRMDNIFLNAERCSNYLTVAINAIMEKPAKNEVTVGGLIYEELNTAKIIFDEIASVVFIDRSRKFFTTDAYLEDKEDMIAGSVYLQELKKTSGKSILFPLEENRCMNQSQDRDVLTMGKKVIQITSGQTLGYLFINIGADVDNKYSDNHISSYFLFDGGGTYVKRGGETEEMQDAVISQWILDGKTCMMEEYKGEDCMYVKGSGRMYPYHVAGITNMEALSVGTEEILSIIVISMIVTILLLILFTSILSNWLTKPLVILKEGAEEIANGNMKKRFHFNTGDEIGKLGEIFNYMTDKIAELIRKVDYEARKKREYELSLIQEQVKPHFLYNTLDIIIMLSEMNKNKEAQRVTRKLADYYRSSLSNSEEIISLEKEIHIIEDYLDLQMIRYEDKFTYDLDIDPETEQAMIPKMSLQPLVENAIYHGLKYKQNWGTIRIESVCRGGDIYIRVMDDGIGMEEDKVKELMDRKENTTDHFGIYSVNHRLKLFYGARYGISIKSVWGEGTEATLCIPKNMEVTKDHD